jgi:hypothetical protein
MSGARNFTDCFLRTSKGRCETIVNGFGCPSQAGGREFNVVYQFEFEMGDGRSDQMANSKLPNKPQPLTGLPYKEFVAKHASMYGEAPKNADKLRPLSSVNEPHEPLLRVSALSNSWFGRVLRAAAEENCPAAFRDLVELWCMSMGATPPDGVFVRRPGKPGAPRSEETAKIYATWISLGRPSLGSQKLAHALYGSELTRADAKTRKRLVDKCRQAVRRSLK